MEELMKMLRCNECGSLVSYFGFVRSEVRGRRVKGMLCEVRDDTRVSMERIEKEMRGKYPVKDALLYHSIGNLRVGELVAAVLVYSEHRVEGFEACRYGIDEIKKREPVKRIDVLEE